jgi:hypothetical protein
VIRVLSQVIVITVFQGVISHQLGICTVLAGTVGAFLSNEKSLSVVSSLVFHTLSVAIIFML